MAVDKKISQLTSLAQVDVSASTDVLPIVDTSATETKKITVSALVGAGATAGISGAVLTNGTINSTTIGATTPSTGAFTTLSASSTVSGTGFSTYLASPPAIGSTAANTGAFTTLTTSSTVTLSGGSANGVLYLNGSKVATSGSALTFDGTTLTSSALTVSGASTLGGSTDKIIINRLSDATAYGSVTFNGLLASTTMTGLYGRGSGGDSGSLFYTVATGTNHIWQIAGSEQMRLNSTGLGIGTASPANKLDVVGGISATKNQSSLNLISSSGQSGFATITNSGGVTYVGVEGTGGGASFSGASANASIIGSGTTNPLQFVTNTTVRATLDSSGNLGLGVTPSAWGTLTALQVKNAALSGFSNSAYLTANAFYDGTNFKYIASSFAAQYRQQDSQHIWYTAPSGTAGNAITFTQAMTLDASGNLIVGGTSAPLSAANRGNVTINGSSTAIMNLTIGGTNKGYIFHDDSAMEVWNADNSDMKFATNNTERARITAAGDFLVGMTSASDSSTGAYIQAGGGGYFGRVSNTPLIVNRKTDDGTLVAFYQDSVTEGSISVSGNTVSYNAFAGSHWSQLQDGSKPDILRGTVMESINELCVWPGEQNERLPKSKVSDTAGSKKVYGVFMAWDNGWTATNDMYVTAVGAFICRVNGSVTVQEGDLLESNGDGTARVQADDIIRSSTIGKVTSTVKTHQYDDGSYCVPTVLYCG